MECSSQSWIVIVIHLQIFLLLLVTFGFVGRCTVHVIIVLLTVEFILDLEAAVSSTATTTST